MRNIKGAFVFLAAFIIAQAPLLAPWYCGLFLMDTEFTVHRFDRFYQSHEGDRFRYVIPVRDLSGTTNVQSVSLGIIRPMASILCGDGPGKLKPVLDMQRVDLANTPIDINLDAHPACKNTIAVDIKSNAVIGRQHSGLVVFGSKRLIEAVSAFVTFFSDRIRLILTFVVIFVLFVNTRNKVLGLPEVTRKEFSPNLLWWSLFLGVSSGLVSAIFPFVDSPELTL
jgi:hypothetical protein